MYFPKIRIKVHKTQNGIMPAPRAEVISASHFETISCNLFHPVIMKKIFTLILCGILLNTAVFATNYYCDPVSGSMSN